MEKLKRLTCHFLLILIRGYGILISPALGMNCRYFPSCSNYAYIAIEHHGLWRGSWLTIKRLLRCHPFCKCGFDPVPDINSK